MRFWKNFTKNNYKPKGNINIGAYGEKIAEKYLCNKRLHFVDRNYRTPFGEIDLILKEKGGIVFVEVKTRISERRGPPLSAITLAKKGHIIKNCQYYLLKNNLIDAPCRIDVVGIKLNRKAQLETLTHIKSAITL